MVHNTEDKDWWCQHGFEWERRFVNQLAPRVGLDVQFNPEKKDNPYAHDLLVDGAVADLKHQQTPFFTAGRYDFDPTFTVTFNQKDYERYSELYPEIAIYFWVDWRQTEAEFGETTYSVTPLKGVWVGQLPLIAEYIEEEKASLHSYKRRKGDQQGNAKCSYLLDLRWLDCLWLDSSLYQHASTSIPFSRS